MKIELTDADIQRTIKSLPPMPKIKPVDLYTAEDFDFLPEGERENAAKGANMAAGLVIDAAERGYIG